jgi:hypothetical protein
MKNREKYGNSLFLKCIVLPCNLRQFALQSASNHPCDLTQITVLLVSDSTLIQYELRSYPVQSQSAFTSDVLFPVPECTVATYVFFYEKF